MVLRKAFVRALIPCLLALGFLAQIPAGTSGQTDSTQYTIQNCVNTFSREKAEETKAGYQYWFVDRHFAGGKTLKMSVVRPRSATHAPHAHPEDEFFFILEGEAEFFLAGETRTVGKNTSLYCPANVEHGIRNVGDVELKYLVIKRYPETR